MLVCEEVKAPQINEASTKMMFVVFYACVIETDDDGIFVDSTYFGGTTITRPLAEELVRDITNDKNMPGAIVPKILSIAHFDEMHIAHDVAQRHFNNMAREMYSMEDINKRGKRK